MAKPARALEDTKTYKIKISGTNGAYSVDTERLNVVLHDSVKFKNNCAAAVNINFTLANGDTPTAGIGPGESQTFTAEVVGTVSYSITAEPLPGKKGLPGDDPYTIIVGSSDSSARS